MNINIVYSCLLLAVLALASSCGKDDADNGACAGTYCVNGSIVETNGACSCDCAAGYRGLNCNIATDCQNLNCGDHGTCNSITNVCDCDEGYEGANCQFGTNQKFLGTYSGEQDCSNMGNETFSIDIAAGSGPDEVLINNFANLGQTVVGKVSYETIFISNQYLTGNNNIASGSGYLQNDTLLMEYRIEYDNGSISSYCQFVGTR